MHYLTSYLEFMIHKLIFQNVN